MDAYASKVEYKVRPVHAGEKVPVGSKFLHAGSTGDPPFFFAIPVQSEPPKGLEFTRLGR